jgi:hypothetical protein
MRFCLSFVLLFSTLAVACASQHQGELQTLMEAALDRGRSTAERTDAVRKLASFQGEESKRLLLQIASSNSTEAPIRAQAVAMLKARSGERVSDVLARLLQPHSSLSLRMAVAEYLKGSPCAGDCIRSILHYQERIWRGDNTSETEMAGESMRGVHSEDQEKLAKDLSNVLLANRSATLGVLMEIYGLGSRYPSQFSLEVIDRLSLRDACSELVLPFRVVPPPVSVLTLRAKLSCPE